MIELRKTCDWAPEQYDAYKDGKMVGYLRLRHGHFTVQCPDVGGDLVYQSYPSGNGTFDDDEREGYLNLAKLAIEMWISKQEKKMESAEQKVEQLEKTLEEVTLKQRVEKLEKLVKELTDDLELAKSDLDNVETSLDDKTYDIENRLDDVESKISNAADALS